jgi:hypothetical protein
MSKIHSYVLFMAFTVLVLVTISSVTRVSDAQTLDTTGNTGSTSPFEVSEPALNQIFTWTGLSSSLPRQLPGEEPEGQTAIIIPPREDDGVYSGMLDYSSSRPVDVIAWNVISPNNDTSIPEEFGDIDDYAITGDETVVFTTLGSGTSGSVPFNANAIELISAGDDDGDPFLVAYSLRAYPSPAEIVNNLASLAEFSADGSGVDNAADDDDDDGDESDEAEEESE